MVDFFLEMHWRIFILVKGLPFSGFQFFHLEKIDFSHELSLMPQASL